jgi:hypothetical protein
MKPRQDNLWAATIFSAVLSGISLVAFVASPVVGNAWVPAFVCFLPMAFFFAAHTQQETRNRVRALEEKLRRFEEGEAQTPAASSV